MGKITNQELDTTLVTQLSNSDSHIANTSNPHSVTASQVGAEPANANIQTHISSTSNPHNVTASQVGAEPAITAGTTGQYWRGDKTWQTLPSPDLSAYATKESPTFTGTVSGVTATMVGLGNVTNESKTTMFASPTFTGTPTLSGAGRLISDSASTGTDIYSIWSGTQAQYDAIGTKDSNTLYFIV